MKKYILGLLMAVAGFLSVHAAAVVGQPASTSNNAGATSAISAAASQVTNAAATTGTATTAASPATPSAKTNRGGDNGYLGLAIWAAVILGLFGFLWAKGYLVKIRNYIQETQEELKKCSWPSREELKGSTVVIMVTILLLGVFTVGVDWILANLIRLIT